MTMPQPEPAVLDALSRVARWSTLAVLLIAGRGWYKGKIEWLYLTCAIVVCAATLWAQIATSYVPEPYLDEVFHIPQAQKYCEGKWSEWDDKITTPPGLYLLTTSFSVTDWWSSIILAPSCGVLSLRTANAIVLAPLTAAALGCRQAIESLGNGHGSTIRRDPSSYAAHTALNIALFPLLFFFSGLYYTDVASTFVVLVAFQNSLRRMGPAQPTLARDIASVVLGVLALLMRQTNVFWVVVFNGGLEAVHAVKTLHPRKASAPQGLTLWEKLKFSLGRWTNGDVHDLPLNVAWEDDMLFCALSLLIAGACNPLRVIRKIWPHITVLGVFVAFVVWNGGVVLGDKSNHVATVHLAQMLYIWPFFAFFSLPLLLPYAWNWVFSAKNVKTWTAPAALLRSGYVLATTLLSCGIVKYNTIVHPFTLADNRHYMFYVFRYIIRRSGAIRQFLVLPYSICRWLVLNTLAGPENGGAIDTIYRSHPFKAVNVRSSEAAKPDLHSKGKPTSGQVRPAESTTPVATTPASTSTALIFLLTTALSLITAPLVEPRYCIIPWVTWRLLVPAWHPPLPRQYQSTGSMAKAQAWAAIYDIRLVLETVWFILINVVTMAIFLYKPYVWRAEDGTVLDGGRLQRFMW
ncbi:DIE2/ALG10 family-domain-containing protein [Emericellopsis atlantica]|uniref:Dol-P-Glc:Glc(2)Man(9)GlcNAc(2)-PP-Dol alpha-1,2-glucosyltransferase n=1 Tax=Emericellopsis atlantica TaxID=2614577 RepID=A0A9P7ZHU4_9HYPO|nr:DIE2/ALG10 family-domain-containing protein [Emericellopsis atlantica]KAG9251942.1 DIE2/ALG10 family-domain-containing protein [Emericellopsis atlantica]